MKRSLSLVLVLALVLGMFSAFALSAGAEDTNAENPGTTEQPNTPVEIATAEEFAAMAADGNYKLTADITVSATYETTFIGTFDGNGHTITTSVPLFKLLTGATVKNLTIAGEINSPKDTRVAALAREGSALTIENVTNNANITVGAKSAYVGGFVGQGLTGNGTAENREKSYFTNCTNNGNITYKYDASSASSKPRIGGITGNVAKWQYAVYTNCENNGNISVTGTGLTGAPYVSGIAGSSFGGEFVNCVNNGDLYCTVGAHMGGILGRGTPSGQGGDQSSKATGCVNTGNLTIESTTSTSGSVGGIFGNCGADPDATVTNAVYTVENSVNTGTLTCSGSNVGGIIGYVWGSDSETKWSYPVIKNCINLGKIVATKNITFAEGEVPNPNTMLATFASQFMGYVNAVNTTIENCYGFGTVENANDDYSVIFGLSSATALNFNIKNVVLKANDGTKNYSWACDTATAVKDEAGKVIGYTVTSDRTANRVSLDAYKAMEGKAGNVVNANNFYVVDGTEGKTLADALAAVADGEYIVLMTDVKLDAAATVEKSNMTFTINGMGHTITGNVTLKTPGCTVNVNNLKIVGKVITEVNAAETKATLNADGLEIDASASGTALTNNGYWDFNLDNCKFVGKTVGFDNKLSGGGDNAKFVINGSYFEGMGSYALYLRQTSDAEITNSTFISTKNSGIQMITATEGFGSTLKLNNCTITATNAYGVAVNPFNKIYINGGEYSSTGKDACINVNGEKAYGEIRGGKFTSSQNCVVRAYGAGAVLDIYDGEFYFVGVAGGSAVRGGTKDAAGTINIYNGTFSSTGTADAVINGVHAESVINITAGKFINAGTATIPVYTKTGTQGTDSIDFPEGQKEYVLEAPAPGGDDTTTGEQPGGDDTTAGGGDETTAGGDETTAGGDETTAGGDAATTTGTPSDTNKPGDTTKAPEEGGCNGCGGFAVAAQVVALLVGVVGVALVVKRK